MADRTNYKGQVINCIPILRKPEYGTGEIDEYKRPKPDWSWIIDGDEQGFDINHLESNGYYRMKIVLPQKTRLIRYGTEVGCYTAPKGTPYEQLSLPYIKESVFFHEYEVIAESITVMAINKCCEVERGRIAPGFEFPGGGIQYLHPYTMVKSINLKLLKEII